MFIDFFRTPGLGAFDKEDDISIVYFAVQKMKAENNAAVEYHESGNCYSVPVSDLTQYILQYFNASEEIVENLPRMQESSGQIFQLSDKVVFYDEFVVNYLSMKVSKIEKDDKYFYVSCYFPEYSGKVDQTDQQEAMPFFGPREYVVSIAPDGSYRLCKIVYTKNKQLQVHIIHSL